MIKFIVTVAFFSLAAQLQGCGSTVPSDSEPGNSTAPKTSSFQNWINVKPVPNAARCEGRKIGVYSWDQKSWRAEESSLVSHLAGSNAHKNTCGDVFINVADYSNPDRIESSEVLVPFMKNLRAAGNTGVIWLTYGDVTSRNGTACIRFVETFFDWARNVSEFDARTIQPIGISFDIENFPASNLEQILKTAQSRKNELEQFEDDGILVQCTIDDQLKPVETDIIMRNADRALAMLYRNYLDSNGSTDGLFDRTRWLFREQCEKCLNDSFAVTNYKAKVTMMLETACKLGLSCGSISFCAFDEEAMEYLTDVVDKVDAALVNTGLMTAQQRKRLISESSPFALHHWEWAQCFYKDPSDTNELCKDYHSLASDCRSQ